MRSTITVSTLMDKGAYNAYIVTLEDTSKGSQYGWHGVIFGILNDILYESYIFNTMPKTFHKSKRFVKTTRAIKLLRRSETTGETKVAANDYRNCSTAIKRRIAVLIQKECFGVYRPRSKQSIVSSVMTLSVLSRNIKLAAWSTFSGYQVIWASQMFRPDRALRSRT